MHTSPAPPRKLLVLIGHPRPDSFCAALAAQYAEGARESGIDTTVMDLSAFDFDPDVHPVSPRAQSLEPDLIGLRDAIAACDHLALFYPSWWGTFPARLKGALDRVLLPGFAFEESGPGRYQGLLAPRTAHLVYTLDMPPWVFRWIQRAPGENALRRSVLGLCGVPVAATLACGPVNHSSAERRTEWLREARRLGASLREGAWTGMAACRRRAAAWISAMRLQFHPSAWIGYAIGALAAGQVTGTPVDRIAFVGGLIAVFLVECATVFTNERFDHDSDRRNDNHSAFSGGSRVLVTKRLDPDALARGTNVALAGAAVTASIAIARLDAPWPALAWLLLMVMLGIGYTRPPLRLCWRTLGELDVAFTHSVGVIAFGWLLQGGAIAASQPWLLALPAGLAILPAILLSAIPDMDADRAAGKWSFAVRFGADACAWAANGATVATVLALAVVGSASSDRIAALFDGALVWMIPHALVFIAAIVRERRRGLGARRIDGLMAWALTFSVPPLVVPLLHLL